MAITTSYSWLYAGTSILSDIFTAGDQSNPAVIGNSAGDRYFAAWTDPANLNQIEGRVVAADQTPLTGELTVNNTVNAGVQVGPSVAGLTGGDFVVTYTDYASDPGGDIRARLYTSSGTPSSIDFAIDDGGNDDTGSSVSKLSDGGFVVTWQRNDINNGDIRASTYDANGNVVNSTVFVTQSAGSESHPSVAGLTSGGFVAVWQDNTTNEVYFRRYQSGGTALDADRVLIDSTGSVNRDIHVVALADGGFAVAYTDNGWNIDGTEITFRIFNADGTARTSFIRANNAAFDGIEGGDQNLPTITTMGDLIVVGWVHVGTTLACVQVFDAQGNRLGDNRGFYNNVLEHELAGLANGQLANVWQSQLSEGLGLGDSMRADVMQFVRNQAGDGANDVIIGLDDDLKERLVGGDGNDILIGGAGGDLLWGDAGSDTASYETAPAGVTASLADPSTNTGHAAGDTYLSIERLTGSAFDDTLIGNASTNTLVGGAGNDTLIGGAGNDRIDGGAGDDTAGFALNFNDYTVYDFGAEIVVAGPDGNRTLRSIEHLEFADTTLALADVANDGNPLFDTLYYLSRNADVFQAGVNALEHYNTFGWHEGRDPNALFDTSGYLAANPGVAASGVNPLEHYHQTGWHEGRDPAANFDTTLYLLDNPDVAAAGVDPLAHYLQHGFAEGREGDFFQAVGNNIIGGFDAQYYLFHNPDVAAAGVDPLLHYNAVGWQEGRDPNGWFDTSGYLAYNDDVAAAGINPFDH
jgi:hypothetical protein